MLTRSLLWLEVCYVVKEPQAKVLCIGWRQYPGYGSFIVRLKLTDPRLCR